MKSASNLTRAAVLIILSIVLGKMLSLTLGPVRISLENLPVLLAGIWMGPIYGMVVGALADILGSLLVGYTINPLITLGAAMVGFVAGLVYHGTPSLRRFKMFASVFLAHLIGSIFIKSLGLVLLYGYPWIILAYRAILYIVIGIIETILAKYIIGHFR